MNKLSKEQLVKEILKHTSSFDVKSLTRASPDNLRVILDLLDTDGTREEHLKQPKKHPIGKGTYTGKEITYVNPKGEKLYSLPNDAGKYSTKDTTEKLKGDSKGAAFLAGILVGGFIIFLLAIIFIE